jgi:hypothetical protein
MKTTTSGTATRGSMAPQRHVYMVDHPCPVCRNFASWVTLRTTVTTTLLCPSCQHMWSAEVGDYSALAALKVTPTSFRLREGENVSASSPQIDDAMDRTPPPGTRPRVQ